MLRLVFAAKVSADDNGDAVVLIENIAGALSKDFPI